MNIQKIIILYLKNEKFSREAIFEQFIMSTLFENRGYGVCDSCWQKLVFMCNSYGSAQSKTLRVTQKEKPAAIRESVATGQQLKRA
jgi:hypothetical protein